MNLKGQKGDKTIEQAGYKNQSQLWDCKHTFLSPNFVKEINDTIQNTNIFINMHTFTVVGWFPDGTSDFEETPVMFNGLSRGRRFHTSFKGRKLGFDWLLDDWFVDKLFLLIELNTGTNTSHITTKHHSFENIFGLGLFEKTRTQRYKASTMCIFSSVAVNRFTRDGSVALLGLQHWTK